MCASTTRLLIAPAASGKTQYVLEQAQEQAKGLAARPLIIVPGAPQRRSALDRLAQMGGALGPRVLIFDAFARDVCREAGDAVTFLDAAAQRPRMGHILRAAAETGGIVHYLSLATSTRFAARLCTLYDELLDAGITASALAQRWTEEAPDPRRTELASIYASWEAALARDDALTPAGTRLRAADAITAQRYRFHRPTPVYVDGFDRFSLAQIVLMQAVQRAAGAELHITLTGEPSETNLQTAADAHRRFVATRLRIEALLDVAGEPLPPVSLPRPTQSTLRALRDALRHDESPEPPPAGNAIALVEASTRALEAREAVRWVKQRIVLDGYAPGECAILARHSGPYESYLDAAAADFGTPLYFEEGVPLGRFPVIAAILRLLQCLQRDDEGALLLPRQEMVSLWRSPFFDWSACGFAVGDAALLDALARTNGIAGGEAEWNEALRIALPHAPGGDDESQDESDDAPHAAIDDPVAARLFDAFQTFVALFSPPPVAAAAGYARWLRTRLSDEPPATLFNLEGGGASEFGLGVARCVRTGDAAEVRRDAAALKVFHEILDGFARNDDAVQIPYKRFVADLAQAVEAARVQPDRSHTQAVHVSAARLARGLPFRAVALLGLAEGEFPSLLREDPFLRDEDRALLRRDFPDLDMPTASAERELLVETLARATDHLLVTRPRLAHEGAEWEPSPFWDAIQACADVRPTVIRSGQAASIEGAACYAELLHAHAQRSRSGDLDSLAANRPAALHPDALTAIARAATVLLARASRHPSPFDGGLEAHGERFAQRFGPSHRWSPSALETYRSCAFHFLLNRALRLEAPITSDDDLDASRLGMIYHAMLAATYAAVEAGGETGGERPADGRQYGRDSLLAAFDAQARRIADDAPRTFGFRPPSGWRVRKEELIDTVRRCVDALATYDAVYIRHEVYVGDDPLLRVPGAEDDSFLLHGRIDRIDELADGRFRLIDYKTSDVGIGKADLEQGRRIQIPLYAWALERLSGAGHVADGFYFAISKAKPGALSLDKWPRGAGAAADVALAHAWAAVRGARSGRFAPLPPAGGCPEYCPAVAFCVHYSPRRRG